MPENIFVGSVAHAYDASAPEMFTPEVLAGTTAFLAHAASGGCALEFAIGTGRVALPLSARGVDVAGIDISEDMIAELRAKPGASAIATTVGDFATTTVPGEFALVYLVSTRSRICCTNTRPCSASAMPRTTWPLADGSSSS